MSKITPADIETNYLEGFEFTQARKKRQVAQLVLLNNLNRGDQNIASTLLITLFNRVMSSLYDDKIQVKFLPSQGITQNMLNSYNTLAQSDYQEMAKAKLDHDWVWDALFFGRGYVETYKFDKKQKILRPEVINPLAFGYDPYFSAVKDWRYYWKWITKSKWEVERLIKAGKITGITSSREIPSGMEQYLWQYKHQRDVATKAVEPAPEPAKNDVYQILEYFGYDEDGKKCVYWVDKMFSKILMKEELELDDIEYDDNGKITLDSKWPLVMKESFRIPHSTSPISVADLLEDKHRAKSVLLNLAFIAAKDAANPLYLYNPDQVKDVTQFMSRQVNQHIPIEGDPMTAVAPLNAKDPMPPGLISFITTLQAEATDPVGVGIQAKPEAGASNETATEVAIDQQLNDMAQSLQSKVLQFGESEFWSDWFHRYQKHADELEEKMANIVGVRGVTSTTINLKDFKTKYPPGVLVYSAKEAEYKELVMRRDLMELYPALMQSMDPEGLRNFNKHVFFPKFLQDPSLIDVMFPKTTEEMKAEAQNEMLAEDKMPPVLDSDDHTAHIYIHMMVQPKTWATWLHIQEHEKALDKKRAQEQAMMQQEMMGAGQGSGQGVVQSPQKGTSQGMEKKSPMAAASPLKQETKKSNQSMNSNY